MTRDDFEASIADLPAQPFIARTRTVPMAGLGDVADEIPGLFGWLAQRGLPAGGPPFLRYLVIDMAAELVVQAGVPVPTRVEPSDGVEVGELPAGRYATTTHVGPYDELVTATRNLLEWADRNDLTFDRRDSTGGDAWGSRVEWYETDPATEPDPAHWVTRLAFRLAD